MQGRHAAGKPELRRRVRASIDFLQPWCPCFFCFSTILLVRLSLRLVSRQTGPLCGTCKANYFRSRLQCLPCAGYAGRSGSVADSLAILSGAAAIVITLTTVYLIRGGRAVSRKAAITSSAFGVRCSNLSKLASLLYQRIVTGAAIARIALGYSQCLSMQRRFLRVRWPHLFERFLMVLDQLTLEIFDLVPAECALGRRLGFNIELYATLTSPFILLVGLLVLAFLLAPLAKQGCCSLRSLANWPQIWDLAVWLLLLQFPTISRKTLTVFDCVPYEETWLLRSDPSLRCWEGQWWTWSTIAASGACIFCLGVPLFGQMSQHPLEPLVPCAAPTEH